MVRFVTILLAFSSLAYCDALAVGVRGGVPLTDAFSTTNPLKNTPQRFTIGPSVEVRLPMGLGVEVDALYRRVKYESGQSSASGSSWQFPVLAKYRFPMVMARPFVDAGYVYNRLSDVAKFGPKHGFAMGGGVDVKLIKIHVSPEIRFTRFGSNQTVLSNLDYNKNQVDFLVGITF